MSLQATPGRSLGYGYLHKVLTGKQVDRRSYPIFEELFCQKELQYKLISRQEPASSWARAPLAQPCASWKCAFLPWHAELRPGAQLVHLRSSCVWGTGTGRGGALLMVTQPQGGRVGRSPPISRETTPAPSACRQLLGASAPRHTTSGGQRDGKGMFVKQRAEERVLDPMLAPGCPLSLPPSGGTGEVLTRQGESNFGV